MGRHSDPVGQNGGINSFSYAAGNPVLNVDPIGLAAICTQDGDAIKVDIPITFHGAGATSAAIASIGAAIQSAWSGPGFQVTVSSGPQNSVELLPGTGRDGVSLSGNVGRWHVGNDRRVAVHETGHLMGLSDGYVQEVRGGKSRTFVFPGMEGTLMGENGPVSDADRKAAVSAACGCK